MTQNKLVTWLVKIAIAAIVACFVLTGIAQSYSDDLTLTPLDTSSAPVKKEQVALPTNPTLNVNALYSPPTSIQRAAFNAVARQALPMTPYQINKLKQMMVAAQQAAAAPANTPPKPVTSSILVGMSPGSTPPVILLQQGFISSLVFVDATGNKWPIEGYDLGNPNAFNVEWQTKSNVLLIQANTLFTYGNLAVKLEGLPTPVMLTLIPGQQTVDYRVDVHVQGQSPEAPAIDSAAGIPAAASNTLLDVLNGIPPEGATTLQMTGGSCNDSLNNCQAWYAGSHLYVRIPMAILSPGWISKMQSSDGMIAYELDKTPSLLVADYGKTTQLKIEGF